MSTWQIELKATQTGRDFSDFVLDDFDDFSVILMKESDD